MEAILARETPGYAVVDLKLGTRSGLPCVERLHAHSPAMRIVVLTGYASIATAVEAIKLGASHYLVKPSNTDDIEHARSEEHTSELKSLMRISYAVFCLKKKTHTYRTNTTIKIHNNY